MRRVISGVLIMVAVIIVANAATLIFTRIDCSYSNYNGTFTFEEMNFKERNFAMCQWNFEQYKKRNGSDTVLYRLCKKNVLHFWNWGHYLLDEKFRLPYMAWEEVKARRGAVSVKSGFQDF